MLGIGVFLLSIAFVTAVRVPMGMRAPPVPKDTVLPSESWYTQLLDHISANDTTTWQQRYFVNDSFWTPTGPVFLLLGGEGEASPAWLVGDNELMLNARKYGAMAIMLEHRYYGESHPTPDASLPNLKYLSSQQALADAAGFCNFIAAKYKLSDSNKWVVFGGSYSGALAAWMRILYPEIVEGAVASSAPVLAELNFYQYLEVVNTSLALTKQGAECNENIQFAFTELDKMLQDVNAWSSIDKQFFVNPPLKSMDDVRQLAQNLIGIFGMVVQYNDDNFTTDDLCNIMCDASEGTPLQRLAALNLLYLKKEGLNTTYASYSGFIYWMKMSGWNAPYVSQGARQWYYQTCTEFGYFKTTDSDNQPFGNLVNLDSYTDVCYDVFNITQSAVLQAVNNTNNIYGGKNISTNVTNIVFPNGSIDPWHALGITQNITDQLPAIFIEGTSHGADMHPPKPSDLPGLTSAREEITTLIGTWLMV